jgi:arylsulfatase A-like enzyme
VEYLERSYQIADRNLEEIIDAAGLHKTNVIAVSDHGMAPQHTRGFPNRVAPTVAELIGMEPPTDAQGKAINSAIK